MRDKNRREDAGTPESLIQHADKAPISDNSRIYRENEPKQPLDFDKLSTRTADEPIDIPACLPCHAPAVRQHRFTDSHVYPTLETNVDASTMAYSQEPIPETRTQRTITLHGHDSPFRHHSVIRSYIEGLINRNGYPGLVEYNTTVERAVKDGGKWILTLRRAGRGLDDYWWNESFDALVVASGHYAVPYIPKIPGLKEFAERYPGSVEHSKQYRGPDRYRGKACIIILSIEFVQTDNA